jgi:hypothetical protein
MRTIDLASIKGMHVTKLSYRGNNIFTIYLNHFENETSDSDVGCNLIGCQYLDFNIPFGNKLLVEDTDIGILGLKHREILHKAGHSIDGFHSLWLKLQGVLPPKIRASGLVGKNRKLATDYEKSCSGLRWWIRWRV